MTANQMKYLLALLHQTENKQNQSSVARIFGVNKSTVSRALGEAVNQGILAERESGYELTGYGREYVQTYEQRLENIDHWLLSQGINPEDARNDSYTLAESCSEATLDVLENRGKIARIYQEMWRFEEGEWFSGIEIAKRIEPGEYHVPFVFQRRDNTDGMLPEVSMANEAFFHPATLIISSSGSYLCLRIKNIVQKSRVKGEVLEGKLQEMKYINGEKENTVMLNDEKVYIPIGEIQFYYIKQDNLLRGCMKIKMSCTVGDIHMPESIATLIVYI